MTQTDQSERVEVIDADRELFIRLFAIPDRRAAAVMEGGCDYRDEMQALARHRLASLSPADSEPDHWMSAWEPDGKDAPVDAGENWHVVRGGANSHCFDDRIYMGEECVGFVDEDWTDRLLARLAPANPQIRRDALEEAARIADAVTPGFHNPIRDQIVAAIRSLASGDRP